MKEFSLQTTFETERKILHFAGIYPEAKQKFVIFHNFKGYVFSFLSCLMEVFLLIVICRNLQDFGNIMGSLMLFVQQTAFISKLSILIYKRKDLKLLEDKLADFSHHPFVLSDTAVLKSNLDQVSMLGFIYRVSCAVCCTFFGAGAFIKRGSKYELPMIWYLPFKITNNMEYIAIFICQMGSLYIAAALNTTVDILNCRLITMASSLFEILIKRLENTGCHNTENQQYEFKKCIHFHIRILSFIKGIEDLYSYIVFSQFAASVIVICSTAFELLTLPVKSGEFIGSLMYLINMITEVALYCCHGHYIQTLSEYLGTACYMSQWYRTEPKTKNMIKIFMERTKRPVTLTAAKLFPLSLTTLKMILRSSYSYFAVLQRVYSDK